MLRTICKQMLTRIQPLIIPKKGIMSPKNEYTIPTNAFKTPREIHSVTLMGTIEHEVKQFPNGIIHFFLKTLNKDTSYCVHKVVVANPKLKQRVEKRLKINQRVYVGGRMKTDFVLVDNRPQLKVEILANELFHLESNPQINDQAENLIRMHIDHNHIEMLTFIRGSIKFLPNSCAFGVVNHYIKNKGTTEETEEEEIHRVLIRDDSEMLRRSQHLRKHDRVYINGFINYTSRTHADGNVYTSGFIQPTDILKLRKFGEEEMPRIDLD